MVMRFAWAMAAVLLAGLVWSLQDTATDRSDGRRPATHPERDASDQRAKSATNEADGEAPKPTAENKPVWTVRFLGRDNSPVTPRFVTYIPEGGEATTLEAEGNEFPLPGEGGEVSCRGLEWPVTKPETTIRLPGMVPHTIEVRDAETGAMLLEHRAGHADTVHGGFTQDPDRLNLTVPDRVIERWSNLHVVSRYANKTKNVVRAFPEAKITLSVSGPDGFEEGARIEHVISECRQALFSRVTGTSDARGILVVEGAPLLHGETLTLVVEKDERREFVAIALDRTRAATANVTLPRSSNKIITRGGRGLIGLGGSTGGQRNESTGAIAIRAYRNDGSPARHAAVRLRGDRGAHASRTNENGHVEIGGITVGHYTLWLEEHGILFTKTRVTIMRNRRIHATITEPRGWSTRLRVLDAFGDPVSLARVTVSPTGSLGYVRIEDGVQHFDHLTDRDGYLEVGPLPPGDASIAVQYGTRKAKVTVGSSKRLVVITLPRAK